MLTDSGGVQEETTILNVPCITLRENTERPVTITQGTNVLVGTETEKILAADERRAQPPEVAAAATGTVGRPSGRADRADSGREVRREIRAGAAA